MTAGRPARKCWTSCTDYLPITAFLIADAARQNLSYWKAFVAAGG